MKSDIFLELLRNNREKEHTTEAILEKPMYLVWQFNLQRQSDIDMFVFVEGVSDKHLYEAVDKGIHKTEYLAPEGTIGGKNTVVKCLKQISEKKEFETDFERCVFVIDRDYDPDVQYTGYLITKRERERIAITKGHSLENYLYYENNIELLRDTVNCTSMQWKEFLLSVENFCRRHISYFAACATITEATEFLQKPQYSKAFSTEQIFVYIFPDSVVNQYAYRKEKERMSVYIESNDLEKVFSKYKKMIKSSPALYIRGHNLYSYIQGYAKYYWNVDIGEFPGFSVYGIKKDSFSIEWDSIT